MRFIPVIDTLAGQVVRGVGGRRDDYRPLSTPLVASSAAPDVVAAFLALHPFVAVYMADLDAIENDRPNVELALLLLSRFPGLELWLDAGFCSEAQIRPWLGHARLRPVLGSESQHDLSGYLGLRDAAGAGVVLSLDFRGDEFVGPPALLADASCWPARVIAMTMDRVGIGAGPAQTRLRGVIGRRGDREVYAAGGVRGAEDVRRLPAGCAGVLLASALHDGSLTSETLRELEGGG